MNPIRGAIANPVKVTVGVLFVLVFGMVGLLRMPIQLAPEVEIPRITVETRWPGASPAEIEREITDEQEEQLNSVEGVTKLESESSDSISRIVMEFPVGSDIDAKILLVNNKLNQVKEYPADADQPVISNTDSANNRPIAWFMLRPRPEKKDEIDIVKRRTFAENVVEAELEKVAGVAAANTFGGQEKRLEVVVDPQALAARQISVGQLRRALLNQNKDTSGGDFWEGKRRYVLRTLGRFRTPEQVENTIIVRRDGQPVYVRDVAEVRLGYEKPESLVRQKGDPTIAMNVLRANGTNVLEVMRGVKDKVEELNAGILAEAGLEMKQVYDETEYITSAIDIVWTNIAFAAVLTTIVLFLFLRSFAPTVVIFIAIPSCIVGTFFLFSAAGQTLNVISLAGIAFAVGMVVDNAIVVLENIYRHHELGKPRYQAAIDGAKEVWGAVLASTLTTLAVFVPVIFVQEEAGQLFRDIAIAISCAVFLSLVAAMFVIPTASARILSASNPNLGGDGGSRSAGLLSGMNRWVLQSRLRRVALVALCFVGSIVGSRLLMPGTEYLPEGNRNLVIGLLLPPPGYNLDEMMAIGQSVEAKLEPYWSDDSPVWKEEGVPQIEHFFFVARGRQLFMGVKAYEPSRVAELIPVLQKAVGDVPGMIPVVRQTSLFQGALEGSRVVDIEITGDDLEKLVGLGRQIFGQVLGEVQNPESPLFNAQARPIPSLDLSNPEVHVVPRDEVSADLGIDRTELGYAVDALVDGAYAGDYYDKNDKIDLEIVGAEEFARATNQLEDLYIAVQSGQLVPLTVVADIQLASGPEQIDHKARRRSITIQVAPSQTVDFDDARRYIADNIVEPMRASGALEGGRYRLALGGTADKLAQAKDALWFNLVLALVITYLLMAGLFESFLYPIVIMISVPLAAVGGFAGLALVNAIFGGVKLDIVTMLGFVILIGTVVNNPILIIHQALNLMRDEGYDSLDAVVESTRTRVRPIFMSTMTTVLGLLPLVIIPGAGSEIYRGLGSVVLGGLLVSTLLTLILVPSLFTLVLDLAGGVKKVGSKAKGVGQRLASAVPSRKEATPAPEPVEVGS